ncbi:hypothetical protein G9A89_009551 [Geosiphon pyriformis]|nr:hypothetical protein G9A89_009551 [Geosiphon pyriformis]
MNRLFILNAQLGAVVLKEVFIYFPCFFVSLFFFFPFFAVAVSFAAAVITAVLAITFDLELRKSGNNSAKLKGVALFTQSLLISASYLDDFIFPFQNVRINGRVNRQGDFSDALDSLSAIVIPPFKVSDMVNRKTRKIIKETVPKMLFWAHYHFRQCLISEAEELEVRVIIQNEA